MTKLGEIITLPVPFSKNTLLEIGGDCCNETDLIVTSFPKTIYLWNVQNQQITKEWTIKGSHKITCKAAVSYNSKKYCVVTDNKVLSYWNEEDKVIASSKKSLHKLVYEVLKGCETDFILYKDGTVCKVLNWNDKFEIGKPMINGDEFIDWASSCSCGDKEYIIFVVKCNTSVNIRVCTYCAGNTLEESYFNEVPICPIVSGEKSLSYCVQCLEDQMYFNILWSSGDLSHINLTDGNSSNQVFSKIKGIDPCLASIHALDETQFIVCGARHNIVDSNQHNVGVGIWSTNFNMFQTFQELPSTNYKSIKMHCHHTNIILQTDKGLYMVPYVSGRTTLSSVMGKFSGSSKSNVKSLSKLLKNADQKDSIVLTSNVSTLIESLQTEAESNFNFELPVDLIKQIIQRELICTKDLKILVPLLVKSQSVDVIYECLEKVKDIAESMIVYCLSFFLSCDSNKLKEAVEKLNLSKFLIEEDGISGVEKHRALFINHLLILPYNDIFLLECLQHLSFQHVLVLLGYLHELLSRTVGGVTTPSIEDGERNPTLLQITDWISVLFDAHFTKVIFSQVTRTLLVKLHETLQEKIEFFDEINQLESLLVRLKDSFHDQNSSNKDIGSYCVEILHF